MPRRWAKQHKKGTHTHHITHHTLSTGISMGIGNGVIGFFIYSSFPLPPKWRLVMGGVTG